MNKLSDLGERKLIDIVKSMTSSDIAVGIGDDCAALDFEEFYILISSDMISKKSHISSIMSPWDIGWFITAINLSDLAAKGGKPLGFLLNMGLNNDLTEDDFKNIILGVSDCLNMYNTSLIGGDTKENESMVLSGTIIGKVKKDFFMPRKGACVDDIVVVTGLLGKAAAGFLALKEKRYDKDILNGLIHPIPRINEGLILGSSKRVHCCMDLSDGLSSSLYQLSELNNVGFRIEMGKIPIPFFFKGIFKGRDQNMFLDYLLHFGGDYELLFTCSEDDLVELKDLFEENMLCPIGRVVDSNKISLDMGDSEASIGNKGYQHFKNHFFDK